MAIERIGIDVVMAAQQRYAEASAAEATARASYEGYSWDYHGAHYIKAVDKAREAAEKALNDYIDEVVKRSVAEALAKIGKKPST